jgi:hypothetical protein
MVKLLFEESLNVYPAIAEVGNDLEVSDGA